MKRLNRKERKGLRNIAILSVIVIMGGMFLFRDKNGVDLRTTSLALENKNGTYEKGNNWSSFSDDAKLVLEGKSKNEKALKEVEDKWEDTTPNIKARYGRNVKEVLPELSINLLDEETEFVNVRYKGEREDITKVNKLLFKIMNSYENIMAMWYGYGLDKDTMPNEILLDEVYYNLDVIMESYEELIALGKVNERERLFHIFSDLHPRKLKLEEGIKDLRKGFENRTNLYKGHGFSALLNDMETWHELFDLYEY